jgi:hypothetical protein
MNSPRKFLTPASRSAVFRPYFYPHLWTREKASQSDAAKVAVGFIPCHDPHLWCVECGRQAPLSPQRGEGLRVRGDATRDTVRHKRAHSIPTPHPGPLPVEGRGGIALRHRIFSSCWAFRATEKDVGNDKEFIPRCKFQNWARRGATLDLGDAQASLRDALPPCVIPWLESHGYHHEVAPRLSGNAGNDNVFGPLNVVQQRIYFSIFKRSPSARPRFQLSEP